MNARMLFTLFGLLLFAPAQAQQAPRAPGGADQALARLVAGNARFASAVRLHPNQTLDRVAEVSKKQTPFAIVLTCSDSRVPPEILFDQGMGDLFVVRVAGNVADDVDVGSIEYAVDHLHVPLVIVMGHARCGAVDATLHAIPGVPVPGHIRAITDLIAPAIAPVKGQPGDPLENAIRANVRAVVARLQSAPPILQQDVKAGKIKIVGAYYDLDSGKVEFLPERAGYALNGSVPPAPSHR